jgi:hypothetical protein
LQEGVLLDPAGSTLLRDKPAALLADFPEGWTECAAVGVERCLFDAHSVFAAMFGGVGLVQRLCGDEIGYPGWCFSLWVPTGA